MLQLFLLLAPAVAIFGASYLSYRRGLGSYREDEIDSTDTDIIDLPESIIKSIGWPYYWGRGKPSMPFEYGINGVDCSGYVQMALVYLGKLSSNAKDRGALDLADDSNPIQVGSQEPGDMAYYPGHVMLVASKPGADGHSAVIGASGGGPTDYGNNPNARVKLFTSALYNKNFVTYMRLKSNT